MTLECHTTGQHYTWIELCPKNYKSHNFSIIFHRCFHFHFHFHLSHKKFLHFLIFNASSFDILIPWTPPKCAGVLKNVSLLATCMVLISYAVCLVSRLSIGVSVHISISCHLVWFEILWHLFVYMFLSNLYYSLLVILCHGLYYNINIWLYSYQLVSSGLRSCAHVPSLQLPVKQCQLASVSSFVASKQSSGAFGLVII